MADDLSVSISENLSLADRLTANLKKLTTSAKELNAASDEFAAPVAELDSTLRKLNLGLLTWHKVAGGQNRLTDDWWRRDVGYARINGKWGLAIRKMNGNENHPEQDHIEEWIFNDAPRAYRIEALDLLPELLADLATNADKTAKKLRVKTVEAQQLAAAVKGIAPEFAREQKGRR